MRRPEKRKRVLYHDYWDTRTPVTGIFYGTRLINHVFLKKQAGSSRSTVLLCVYIGLVTGN